jgi:hypothetical protein
MLEYWNNGVASFGQINACGGEIINSPQYPTTPLPTTPFPQFSKSNIPGFHHSIIPIAERSGA